MANIKLELDAYLNKSQKEKPNNGHVHIPKVFKKFLNNEPGEQTETLLDSAQKTYFDFPSLVRTFKKLKLNLLTNGGSCSRLVGKCECGFILNINFGPPKNY